MRVRKLSAVTLVAVAVGLSLTACGNDSSPKAAPPAAASPVAPASPAAGTPAAADSPAAAAPVAASPASPAHTKPSGTPKATAGEKCTDQINYAGDPRSNAEINSIGANTGHCPTPEKSGAATPSGTPNKPGVKCTDQINYAGDPRSNAEINSIGANTGYCPPIQH
ncbi:hypothetical protein [Kitasatospora viridis]|uniref:Secreted protein n=1 Tax=Kitasatospora viridis TaxID=281105 RepID=A0A561UBD7_9ACTN|nr:hypothetical protein [Kitasatospora viridis]TWF96656.1 hypothetical protein FHX73_11428 [Kitasatospora viridis]